MIHIAKLEVVLIRDWRHDSGVPKDSNRALGCVVLVHSGRWRTVLIGHGAVVFGWRTYPVYDDLGDVLPAPADGFRYRLYPPSDPYANLRRHWRVAGFGFSSHGGKRYRLIPLWAVGLLSAAMPLRWSCRLRTGQRIVGCCSACGYDLRPRSTAARNVGLFPQDR